METRELSMEEMQVLQGGEAITLSAILAIMAIAVMAVVVYRMFVSSNGSAALPGGFKFTWK